MAGTLPRFRPRPRRKSRGIGRPPDSTPKHGESARFAACRGVVIVDIRLHRPARAAVFVRRHAYARVVIERGIGLIRTYNGPLLDQRTAGKEDVVNVAAKDSELESVKRDVQPVALEFRVRRGHFKDAEEIARALRVAGRKIEKLVKSPSSLAGCATVYRLRPADYGLAVHRD